ncbi:hypothetical protein BJ165DRAFT_1469481 [Panaeolus papilionaceus]|nr:hypothetical protein BJ165DRAFT_1469481 [Panaeolus papilionaceus]
MPPKKKQKRNISGLRNQPPRQLPPVIDETNIDSADCSGTSGLSAIEAAGSETQPPNVSPDSKTPEATSSTSSSCPVGDANQEESDNFHASKTENPKEVDTADTPPHSRDEETHKQPERTHTFARRRRI